MPRFVFLAVCYGVVIAAPGCAQIVGLDEDYRHVPSGGQGGAAGHSGATGSSSGTSAATAGDAGAGADGGAAGSDAGGSGGSAGGFGGTASGMGGGTAGTAEPSGGTGGDSMGTSGQGGEPSGSGGAVGNGGTTGMNGEAGATGSGAVPVRIGYSVFSDSDSDPDHANGSVPDATFMKPAGTQAGDLMLVFFGIDHELTIDADALRTKGWRVLIDEHGDGMDGQGTTVMVKVATADEPDMIVFEGVNPALFGLQGLLSVYRGVNPDAPVDRYAIAGTKDMGDFVAHVTTPTPAITTTVSNCLLLAGLSPDSIIDAPVVTAWPEGFADEIHVMNELPYVNGWANIYLAERPWQAPATFPASSIQWDPVADERYYGGVSFIIALAPNPD